jgi:uncharacterized membrane protein YkvA (DUF1232 family)
MQNITKHHPKRNKYVIWDFVIYFFLPQFHLPDVLGSLAIWDSEIMKIPPLVISNGLK